MPSRDLPPPCQALLAWIQEPKPMPSTDIVVSRFGVELDGNFTAFPQELPMTSPTTSEEGALRAALAQATILEAEARAAYLIADGRLREARYATGRAFDALVDYRASIL